MLIVLEGLDGAGKSTQVRKLREYLGQKCPKLEYIHFPRYEAPVYGGLISRFLRGEFGPIDHVHPQLVALLFAEDRHGAAPQIREALNNGSTVLLDRYVYSNIAYQCAKLPNANEAEAERKGADRAYLHHAQDIHEADIEFQKRVRAMYLRQAEVDKSLQVVDCADSEGGMLPPDDIFAKIKALVDSRL